MPQCPGISPDEAALPELASLIQLYPCCASRPQTSGPGSIQVLHALTCASNPQAPGPRAREPLNNPDGLLREYEAVQCKAQSAGNAGGLGKGCNAAVNGFRPRPSGLYCRGGLGVAFA